jgi:hypothetical protein
VEAVVAVVVVMVVRDGQWRLRRGCEQSVLGRRRRRRRVMMVPPAAVVAVVTTMVTAAMTAVVVTAAAVSRLRGLRIA